MRPLKLLFVFYFFVISNAGAQRLVYTPASGQINAWLDSLLFKNDKWLDSVWKSEKKWKIQLYYSKIDRTQNGWPVLTHYTLKNDSLLVLDAANEPLGLVLLAMKKMNELDSKGINLNTTMITESQSGIYGDHEPAYVDPRWPDGRPSLGRYISDLLLLHDEHAFNRIFEFVGPEYVQQQFGTKGISIRYGQRLPQESVLSARNTNKLVFFSDNLVKLYIQEEKYFDRPYLPFTNGFDPGHTNSMLLKDAHDLFMALFFPALKTTPFFFSLNDRDREKLWGDLSQKTEEIQFPFFNPQEKAVPLLAGFTDSIKTARVFHNGGNFNGQWSESVFVIDTASKIEYFLSIGLDTGNDEEAPTAEQLLERVGRIVFEYEKTRFRKYPPNLKDFVLKIDK